MQDAPGVNCGCMLADDPDGAQQSQRPEIIVPDEDEFQGESIAGIPETHDGGQNRCNQCDSRLEWKLRLDGVTVRACPHC